MYRWLICAFLLMKVKHVKVMKLIKVCSYLFWVCVEILNEIQFFILDVPFRRVHLFSQRRSADRLSSRRRRPRPSNPRSLQKQSLLLKLDQTILDFRIFADVKRRFSVPGTGVHVGAVLRQKFDDFEVTPAGGGVNRLPEVFVGDFRRNVIILKSILHNLLSSLLTKRQAFSA